MDLGTFSISLPVADLAESLAFYRTLGFSVIDGDQESWVMLDNGGTKIGLFRGMLDAPMLTFHPPDARAVETVLIDAGHPIVTTTEGDTGPTHFVVTDPDGHMMLFDQHGD